MSSKNNIDIEEYNIETVKTRGNIIVRQELASLTPRCDAVFAIALNAFFALIFLIFGIPILSYSTNKTEYRKIYSTDKW